MFLGLHLTNKLLLCELKNLVAVRVHMGGHIDQILENSYFLCYFGLSVVEGGSVVVGCWQSIMFEAICPQ